VAPWFTRRRPRLKSRCRPAVPTPDSRIVVKIRTEPQSHRSGYCSRNSGPGSLKHHEDLSNLGCPQRKGIESSALRRPVPYPTTIEPPPGALQLPQGPSGDSIPSGHRLIALLSSRCIHRRRLVDRLLQLVRPLVNPLLPSSFFLPPFSSPAHALAMLALREFPNSIPFFACARS
jgi:hypothetical protein